MIVVMKSKGKLKNLYKIKSMFEWLISRREKWIKL